MTPDAPQRYRWADFELLVEQRRLLRAGEVVPLEPKVLDLLIELVSGGQRARSRQELLDAVWPNQVVVDDALTQAMRRLRQALGDAGGDCIETLRGHGYRFRAAVEVDSGRSERPRGRTVARPALAAVLLASLLVALATLVLWPEREVRGERPRVGVLAFESEAEAADWVRLGLSAMVADALPAHHDVEVIPPTTVFGLDGAEPDDVPAWQRLADAASADYVLGADVARSASGWTLTYRLWRQETLAWEESISGGQLHELVNRLNVSLTDALDAPRRRQLLPSRLSTTDFVNEAFARGRQARYEGDFAGAAELFRVCVDQDPQLHAARHELADTLRRLGEYAEATELARQVHTAALAAGDVALAADALTTLGLIAWRQGDYDTAAEHVQEALAMHVAEGRRADAAHDQNVLAVILGRRGEHDVATSLYHDALATYRALGDKAGEAKTLNNLGWDAFNRGDYQASLDYDTRALALQEALGLTSGTALTLNNLGTSYLYLGRISAAGEHYQRALAMRRRIGDRAGVVTTLGNLGVVSAYQGDFVEAEQRVREALAAASELGSPELEAQAQVKLGDVLMQAGDHEAAATAFDRAEQRWRELDIERPLTEIGLWRAELALAADAPERARQWLADPDSYDDLALKGRALALWGGVDAAIGDPSTALDNFRAAIAAGRSAGASEVVVKAAIDAAHLCMDTRRDCAGEFVARTGSWQAELAAAAVVNGRWLLTRGKAALAVAELERARDLSPGRWEPRHEAWLTQAREEARQ